MEDRSEVGGWSCSRVSDKSGLDLGMEQGLRLGPPWEFFNPNMDWDL